VADVSACYARRNAGSLAAWGEGRVRTVRGHDCRARDTGAMSFDYAKYFGEIKTFSK